MFVIKQQRFSRTGKYTTEYRGTLKDVFLRLFDYIWEYRNDGVEFFFTICDKQGNVIVFGTHEKIDFSRTARYNVTQTTKTMAKARIKSLALHCGLSRVIK